jgi:hypothetical protein
LLKHLIDILGIVAFSQLPVRIDADIQGIPGLDNVPELRLND